jgi:CubicO group peptidase (beta-lactamase class C family)
MSRYKGVFLLFIFQVLLSSCSANKPNFKPEELIGVWSGVLFQTETSFSQIKLEPANEPTKATLYKDGKEFIYPITSNNGVMLFKGDSGLRFDASYYGKEKILHGVITHDLWAQSIEFVKDQNHWFSNINKPEFIDTDYSVYLEFYRDATGRIQAKIQSNKENREDHFTIEQVSFDGSNIDFNITNKRFGISAVYDDKNKTLAFNYRNSSGKRNISLTKLKPEQLLGYVPRLASKKYKYTIPHSPDDIMETASLTDVGLDMSLVKLMDEMTTDKYLHLHSIIITKNKKLVFEEYFHGYHREYLHDLRSAFKAMTSLVVGKAMMKNSELKLENPIIDFYPQYHIKDPLKKKITVYHALTMTTGLQNENEDKMQRDNADWVEYKLEHPMEYEPGDKYVYSDGGINLLSGVIQSATNEYLPAFLQHKLLLPMGINNFQMLTSPVGRGYLAGNFYLRPIDFTKIGLLMLNQGKWNGEQLITKSWIEESTSPKVEKYHGYFWKLNERTVAGKSMQSIEAWGNGGQFLIIIPEIDMTITFTGGNYNVYPEMERGFKLLEQYIFPAVTL